MKSKIINIYSQNKRTSVSIPTDLWDYYLAYCQLNAISNPVEYLHQSFDIYGGEKVTSDDVKGLIYLYIAKQSLTDIVASKAEIQKAIDDY